MPINGAAPDSLEGEDPEIVPEAEREEDLDLRVSTQGREEPLDHVALRSFSSALGRRPIVTMKLRRSRCPAVLLQKLAGSDDVVRQGVDHREVQMRADDDP
jgi:hypothetical protein